MDWLNEINKIQCKEDFIRFIWNLVNDFKLHKEDWHNKNLLDYLEAIGYWTEDMEGFYINNNQQIPKDTDWKIFANILIGAIVYE